MGIEYCLMTLEDLYDLNHMTNRYLEIKAKSFRDRRREQHKTKVFRPSATLTNGISVAPLRSGIIETQMLQQRSDRERFI